MSGLNVRQDACELDFLSLGALIHRLDPGAIPFRKARSVEVHVSGGEYNVAANLSDCFGLKTGGELTYPGVTGRILTHPVVGLDRYAEMMRLLEDKEALKVFVEVAE